jgi:hypothetical protein
MSGSASAPNGGISLGKPDVSGVAYIARAAPSQFFSACGHTHFKRHAFWGAAYHFRTLALRSGAPEDWAHPGLKSKHLEITWTFEQLLDRSLLTY